MALIVQGVLPGNKGPLFYPLKEIAKNYHKWDMMPLMLDHPTINGRLATATHYPSVWDSHGLGYVRNPTIKGDRLIAEGWFDIERCNKLDKRIISNLLLNKPTGLSTGLFTNNVAADPASNYHGRYYSQIATNYVPDHVAVLVDKVGACSLKDGCGVLVNTKSINAQALEILTANGFNPGQPRDNRGRWSAGGGGKQTGTKAFKNWFGSSKVVDENGEPLVVYHGTKGKDFTEFNTTSATGYDFGSHFGPIEQASNFVSSPDNGVRILPVYLKIEKPLDLPDLGAWDWTTMVPALEAKGISVLPEHMAERMKMKPGKEYNEWAKQTLRSTIEKAGYDGIRYLNQAEGIDAKALMSERLKRKTSFEDNPIIPDDVLRQLGARESWIAMRPAQIKSAIGNKGTFDPDDPIITNKLTTNFNPSQPRDYRGRWSAGGGGASGGKGSSKSLGTAQEGFGGKSVTSISAATGRERLNDVKLKPLPAAKATARANSATEKANSENTAKSHQYAMSAHLSASDSAEGTYGREKHYKQAAIHEAKVVELSRPNAGDAAVAAGAKTAAKYR